MAEIKEVFDDATETIEKTFKSVGKNKTFWWIAGGVGVLALLVYFKKSKNSDSGEYAYSTGYAGYPITGGGGAGSGIEEGGYGYSDEEINSIITEISNSYESTIEDLITEHDSMMSDMDEAYNTKIDELSSNVDSLSNQLITTQQYAESAEREVERQKVLQQMQSNSNLYNSITDPTERAYLHAQNAELGASIGLTFDSHTGSWYDESGNQAYTVSVAYQPTEGTTGRTASSANTTFTNNVDYQNLINNAILNGADASTINALNAQRDAKINATGSSLSSANSYYDKDVDYTKLINEAKQAGASQAVIDNLTAQRQAKIDGEYGGVDPDSKKTSSSSTTKTSSSSTTKKTSSGVSSSSSNNYYATSASSSTKNSNGSTTYNYSNGGSMTVSSNGNVTWVTGRKK